MAQNKDSFVMRGSWVRALSGIPPEEAWGVIVDIYNYAIDGIPPQHLTLGTKIIWRLISEELDRDLVRYRETCKRNAENAKRRSQGETQ